MAKAKYLLAIAIIIPFCIALPPITGPLLPRPSNLSDSAPFNDATTNLSSILDGAINSDTGHSISVNNASFSIALTSFSAPEDGAVLWDYHYLAPERSPNGTNSSSGSSQYMVGSNTKVFTDLLIFKSGIDLNAPVTDFLPELDVNNSVEWQKITISQLTDHLSGLPQDYGFPEIYDFVPLYEQLGFPVLPVSDFPPCGVTSLNHGCNTSQLLTGLASAIEKPVLNPDQSPAYNNLAFALMGIILERHHNDTYSNLINSLVTSLNMTNTGVSPGTTSNAVVPSSDSSWGADFGISAPQGGMFSTTDDLSKFARAILSNSSTLAIDANSWLKPHSLAPGLKNSVGAPWEIYRTDTLLPGQVVDIYAKDGGVVEYFSRMAIVPQYGIAITCLTAGPVGTLNTVIETAFDVLLPAIDRIARQQASDNYAGTYVEADGNATLQIDDGIGLHLAGLTRNDSDILMAIETIYESGIVVAGKLNTNWRIYPTGIERQEMVMNEQGQNETLILEDWRLGIETEAFEPSGDLSQYNKGVFENNVSGWQGLDSMYYGGRAVDRIVAIKSLDGTKVKGLQFPALRMNVWKQG